MANKTRNHPPADKTAKADGQVIAHDFQELDQARVVAIDQAHEAEAALARAAIAVGGAIMAHFHAQMSAAAEVRMFEQIRALPREIVRRIPIQRRDGVSAAADSLDQLCPLVFGRSYNAMAEAAQNFHALGEETYETAARLGLNRSALRAVRALPPAKLEAVRHAIESGGTKAEVLSVIEDLAEKAAQAEEALRDKEAELQVANDAREKQRARIDKLVAAQKLFAALPPDEELAEMQAAAMEIMREARGAIDGRLRQAVAAIQVHGDERHAHDRFLAGLVAEVQHALTALRDEFGLPDAAGDVALPGWLQDDEVAQALAKGGKAQPARGAQT